MMTPLLSRIAITWNRRENGAVELLSAEWLARPRRHCAAMSSPAASADQ
jgi:hypothetical protein